MALQIEISEEELPAKFLEACEILMKLHYFKKKWEKEYGSTNRNNLRRWEEKQVEFLKSLNLKPDNGESNNVQ